MSEEQPVRTVRNFDLQRYLGLWYEIGRLPMKYEDPESSNVTAHYEAKDNGEISVDNRCLDAEGKPTQTKGVAKVEDADAGKLKVSFLPEFLRWISFTEGDYWVLKVSDDYKTALVGTPDRKNLWLLSRSSTIQGQASDEFLSAAQDQGYSLDDWITTKQTGGHVTDEMLGDG